MKELSILSLEKRKVWRVGENILVFKYLNGFSKEGYKLLYPATEGRARGNGFKLQKSRFRLSLRKNLLTVRTERQWDKLPRTKVVESPSLEVCNKRLQQASAWDSLGTVNSAPVQGIELDDL